MSARLVWMAWIGGTLALTGILAGRMSSGDGREIFLPGDMTSGHHQIELTCERCHTRFGGVRQEACLTCHEARLRASEDSHPKSTFTDPRNADRIATLDATLCLTCHIEHRPEVTGEMGLTLPSDFCVHCHSDVALERPSHEGMGFETCASAGCHNFHDNRALYEDFLARNADTSDLLPSPRIPARRSNPTDAALELTSLDADAPAAHRADRAPVAEWTASAHARAGVNCLSCHGEEISAWVESPPIAVCESCHVDEAGGFLSGKHGMRPDAGLLPMSPSMARLPMRPDSLERELGCSSCHGPHDADTRRAAVDACLGCHQDTHTLSYDRSPHAALWRAEVGGTGAAGSGVSCAACHMPREVHGRGGDDEVRVQHNQNWNLRPNEKMLRDVCLRCHGLGFSIDAMADPFLVETNFAGRPATHVESIEMVRRRLSQQRN